MLTYVTLQEIFIKSDTHFRPKTLKLQNSCCDNSLPNKKVKKQTTVDISHMIHLLLTAFQPQCTAYTQIGLKNPAGAM